MEESMLGDAAFQMTVSAPAHIEHSLAQSDADLAADIVKRLTPLVCDEWPYAGAALYANGYADMFSARHDSDSGNYSHLVQLVGDIDQAYQCAELDEALRLCNLLLSSSDAASVQLFGLTKRMSVYVAQANAEAAYADYVRVTRMCEEGIRCTDDSFMCGASCLCALNVENLLNARIFDKDFFGCDMSFLPQQLRSLLGYLLGCRALRQGKRSMAEGIAYSALVLTGSSGRREAVSCNLIMASTRLFSRDLSGAEAAFKRAWALSGHGQIAMPFVEFDHYLLGLFRRCDDICEEPSYRQIKRLLSRYRRGWYDLRRQCGLPVFGACLTSVELYALGLASLGWRNKEIAAHLRISENTLKHRLSSAYQKLGLNSRKDTRNLWHGFIGFAEQG